MLLKQQYLVGNYKLKYNFESNSQLRPNLTLWLRVGNYKLKYNFESNSQPVAGSGATNTGWEL